MDTSNDSIPVRRCKTCNNEHLLTSEHWHKDKSAKYGFNYSCKTCAKVRANKWKHDNQERAREASRIYYIENKLEIQEYRQVNALSIAVTKRAWRKANPDKAKQHKADSQKRNRASANTRSRRYSHSNPEKILARKHHRRALKLANGGTYTPADIALQAKAQTDKRGRLCCWWCGKPIVAQFHIDHRIPLTGGGSNAPENLVLSCPPCNLSKGARLISEWNGRLF